MPALVEGVASRVGTLVGDLARPGAPVPDGVDPGAWRRARLGPAARLASSARWEVLRGTLGAHLGVDPPA